MQHMKYAGKYGVEQQLKLLSKWLAESGFGEAAILVSAAAVSVHDAARERSAARPQKSPPAAPAARDSAKPAPTADGEKPRVRGADATALNTLRSA